MIPPRSDRPKVRCTACRRKPQDTWNLATQGHLGATKATHDGGELRATLQHLLGASARVPTAGHRMPWATGAPGGRRAPRRKRFAMEPDAACPCKSRPAPHARTANGTLGESLSARESSGQPSRLAKLPGRVPQGDVVVTTVGQKNDRTYSPTCTNLPKQAFGASGAKVHSSILAESCQVVLSMETVSRVGQHAKAVYLHGTSAGHQARHGEGAH